MNHNQETNAKIGPPWKNELIVTLGCPLWEQYWNFPGTILLQLDVKKNNNATCHGRRTWCLFTMTTDSAGSSQSFYRWANSYPKQSQSLTQQDWCLICGPGLLAMHTVRRLIRSYKLEKPRANWLRLHLPLLTVVWQYEEVNYCLSRKFLRRMRFKKRG